MNSPVTQILHALHERYASLREGIDTGTHQTDPDWSGEWIYRVGLPAKSGVGGGILAVMQDHGMEPESVKPADCAIFADCDEAELKLLEQRMAFISHAAGETIIQTGTSADELFVLTSGSAEVRLRFDGNRFQRLDVFSAGMSFGELAFLDASPRSAKNIPF